MTNGTIILLYGDGSGERIGDQIAGLFHRFKLYHTIGHCPLFDLRTDREIGRAVTIRSLAPIVWFLKFVTKYEQDGSKWMTKSENDEIVDVWEGVN